MTAAGIVYPYLATQTGQTTISDMGQYWKKTLNELAHDIAVGEGLLPQDGVQKYHIYDPIVLDLDGNGI